MTKPVRDYLAEQMENPEFAAEWARIIAETIDPLEWLRRVLAEVGETDSLPSEDAEYQHETVCTC